jgi:magnesium chelatase accessory protein
MRERHLDWERDRPTWPNQAWSRFVDAGGVRWHVQTAGEGPVILFVHGTGASTHSWRDVLPLLADRFRVLAVDLPGHAFSAATGAARSSLRGMGASLAALLSAVDVRPSYCVGHSAGAALLCRMALDGQVQPRSILSFNGAFLPLAGAAGVVFAPIARVLGSSPLLPRLVARRAGDPATVARLIAGTGSTLDGIGVELYGRLVRDPGHVAGAMRMMGNWDLRDFEKTLPRLKVPLTLVAALGDRLVPARQARDVASRLENARVVSLPGLGHLAHEEAPADAARLILSLCG